VQVLEVHKTPQGACDVRVKRWGTMKGEADARGRRERARTIVGSVRVDEEVHGDADGTGAPPARVPRREVDRAPPSWSRVEDGPPMNASRPGTRDAYKITAMIKLKRAYEPPRSGDGVRLLVDRLWPRGLSKEEAQLDGWLKEIAPSEALRKWFGHDPERFSEFRERYRRELQSPDAQAAIATLAARAARGTVTLVYAAHDEEHNNGVVLAEEVEKRLVKAARKRPTHHATVR
jgi:uncharacterized protein YeaO (DUF488 family)